MVDEEQLKRLRAIGVKSIEIRGDGAHFVEFFPDAPAFDFDSSIPPGEQATDRPPAAEDIPEGPYKRLIKRPSVS